MIPIDMQCDATEWVILYDADCGFCRWSLSWVLRADRRRRLRPVALQETEAESLLADLTPQDRMRSWHLVAPDDRRWSGGHAAPPLLRLLPGGTPVAVVAGIMPAFTERAYRWVADHRSMFSRAIPSGAKARADRLLAQRRADLS
jgi:predicted DCC family thiol-disulfide oxidoreductase YuxK